VVDYLLYAIGGVHLTGMTGYMFDPKIPLFVRGLSTIPRLAAPARLARGAAWLRCRRALQPILATALLLICGPGGPHPLRHRATRSTSTTSSDERRHRSTSWSRACGS
jgi:hypothetical protein